jgi:multiple sugar transport system substrate-binding protein
MKKNLLTMGIAALTLVASLTGCGGVAELISSDTQSTGGNETTSELAENEYDGSAVTVKFYHTMSATTLQPTLEKYIAKFNETFPNIKISHEQIGNYDDVRDKIKTEIAVGSQPNTAYCYPDHVALYNKAKAVQTLDDFINDTGTYTTTNAAGEEVEYTVGLTEEEQNSFIQGYWDEGKAYGDDLMYTLPFSKSTEVLYYNKTFFEANNLTVPTTWDEMWEVCAKIKEIDPKCTPLGYDSAANWFITMTQQLGSGYTSATKVNGTNFLFDNEANRAFITELKEQYDKGYFTTQGLLGAYTSSIFVEGASNDDTKGRSYMSIGSSAGATHQRPTKTDEGEYPFEVGIASIPQADASNPKVISQGPDVVIFKNSNKQQTIASWLFMKYLTTSVEFQAEFGLTSGYVPVLKTVLENETYQAALAKADGYDNIAALSQKVCMEQEEAYFTSPAFVGSSTARDQVGALLEAVVSGSKTIDQAFSDALAECEYSI